MKALQRAKSHAKSVHGNAVALAGSPGNTAPPAADGTTQEICQTRELTLTLKALA
jgi:hypothetical protein